MFLIDKQHGRRPVCRDCKRRVGPAGRKVWRCLDCMIKRERKKPGPNRLGIMELYRYATEGR